MRNNETEDRKYYSNRNNERPGRYDKSRRNNFDKTNQCKGYSTRNNSTEMNNNFENASERNDNWRSRNNSYYNNSANLYVRRNGRRHYEDRNTRPYSLGGRGLLKKVEKHVSQLV